jgi:histidine triad (HIT) family protein
MLFSQVAAYIRIAPAWRFEMEDCVFCKVVRGEVPSFKIFEDERVLCFADINPISRGHCLVIPRAHSENLLEIAAEDLFAVHRAAKDISSALKEVLGAAAGIACIQLNGRAVNQVVMHYHLHLIPRVEGDPPLPVCQWEPLEGDMNEIEKTAAQIASAVRRR